MVHGAVQGGTDIKKIDLGSFFFLRTRDTEPTNLRNQAHVYIW
jgi:hypothetical protein